MRGLGYLPDPPKLSTEKADWSFRDFLSRYEPTTGPRRDNLDELVIDVLDQGELGSCVANAIQQAIRMRHVAQGVQAPVLGSRLMGYYLARAVDHRTAFDTGTYLRTYFEVLNKFGFCDEQFWPYTDSMDGDRPPFAKMPSTKAFHAAFDRRAPTVYRRIQSSGPAKLNDFRHAISAGFPVVAGWDVGPEFVEWTFDHTGPLAPPKTVIGGHAMLILGFDGDMFRVLNSWGPTFGDNGRFWMSPEYAMASRDCWVVEHAPIVGER